MEITVIFRKIEGYTPSGLGSRSFTVDRLAGWQTKIYWFSKAGRVSNILVV